MMCHKNEEPTLKSACSTVWKVCACVSVCVGGGGVNSPSTMCLFVLPHIQVYLVPSVDMKLPDFNIV